jgi:hypothetical protein
MLPPDTTITGLSSGSGDVLLSTAAFGGATQVSVITCADCIFGPTAALSTQLKFSCQNVVLGVVTVLSTGDVAIAAVNATAQQGRRLTKLQWTLSPLLEVCTRTFEVLWESSRVSFLTWYLLFRMLAEGFVNGGIVRVRPCVRLSCSSCSFATIRRLKQSSRKLVGSVHSPGIFCRLTQNSTQALFQMQMPSMSAWTCLHHPFFCLLRCHKSSHLSRCVC